MFRSRGLVKNWQDRYGNLLLKEFSPYTLGIQLENENSPEPGRMCCFSISNKHVIGSIDDPADFCLDLTFQFLRTQILPYIKGMVSPDWKGLHMFSLDRFEV
jgi:hypothetical protein